ncbi:MAG: hypothetical protein JXA28_13505 [Bacteroidetes bacterium]|nr:hypothetical protein [Bacteroidota bacterium]
MNIPDRIFYFSLYYAPPPSGVSRAAPVYPGLAVSDDGGESWEGRGWITNAVNAIAVHPEDREHVMLATDYGILSSRDAGEHWKLVSTWNMPAALDVAFIGGSLWAATAQGIYQTPDNGEQWRPRNAGLDVPNGTYVSSILPLPRNVLIATADGLFRSTDDGESWMRSGLQGTEVNGVVVHPADPSLLAAFSNRQGVWVSSDGGRSWTDRSAGLQFPQVQCAAFDPRERTTLLIGTQRVGVVRSSDLGTTWELSGGGLTNFSITALCFDPDHPDRCYAGAENGSFMSANRGKSWQPFSIRLGYVTDIQIR